MIRRAIRKRTWTQIDAQQRRQRILTERLHALAADLSHPDLLRAARAAHNLCGFVYTAAESCELDRPSLFYELDADVAAFKRSHFIMLPNEPATCPQEWLYWLIARTDMTIGLQLPLMRLVHACADEVLRPPRLTLAFRSDIRNAQGFCSDCRHDEGLCPAHLGPGQLAFAITTQTEVRRHDPSPSSPMGVTFEQVRRIDTAQIKRRRLAWEADDDVDTDSPHPPKLTVAADTGGVGAALRAFSLLQSILYSESGTYVGVAEWADWADWADEEEQEEQSWSQYGVTRLLVDLLQAPGFTSDEDWANLSTQLLDEFCRLVGSREGTYSDRMTARLADPRQGFGAGENNPYDPIPDSDGRLRLIGTPRSRRVTEWKERFRQLMRCARRCLPGPDPIATPSPLSHPRLARQVALWPFARDTGGRA